MDTYHIRGGCPLKGEVTLGGAKNSALPIFAASVVTGSQSFITNCPDITDAEKMRDILRMLGCSVKPDADGILIDSSSLLGHTIDESLMSSMRSSVFLAGPILARCGIAEIGKPGGCKIGARPIDIHINTLKALGAEVEEEKEKIILKANKLKGAVIDLPFPSVGATENAMIAASRAEGVTIINNAAREPEIVDLQNFLNACGAEITGAGSSTVRIQGVKSMHAVDYEIIPDRIEGGTFLSLAVATGGQLFIRKIVAEHMEAVLTAFEAAGCQVKRDKNGIGISGPEKNKGKANIITAPFPGFPTDMQPQFTAAMAAAKIPAIIREEIFENRYGYIKQLNKMGAGIVIEDKNAIISTRNILKGETVFAGDLRGGAALVTAALAAEGESVIYGVEYIKRGYSSFGEKLRSIGAEIKEQDG